ncbi:MAG: SPOR domain-containing protein [Bacteroidetes bacterium]|nr:SPOR domain-containing protein [Bacteroidota bacterium]
MIRLKIVLIVALIFIANIFCFAQPDSGKIEMVQDYKVKELLNKHIEINSKTPVKGYRIKIHFGADKNKAKEMKAKFISVFPQIPAYEKYDQPNFNIRVGDFRTKLEAYKFLKEVQIEFPSAFLVQDEIELPKLE